MKENCDIFWKWHLLQPVFNSRGFAVVISFVRSLPSLFTRFSFQTIGHFYSLLNIISNSLETADKVIKSAYIPIEMVFLFFIYSWYIYSTSTVDEVIFISWTGSFSLPASKYILLDGLVLQSVRKVCWSFTYRDKLSLSAQSFTAETSTFKIFQAHRTSEQYQFCPSHY